MGLDYSSQEGVFCEPVRLIFISLDCLMFFVLETRDLRNQEQRMIK